MNIQNSPYLSALQGKESYPITAGAKGMEANRAQQSSFHDILKEKVLSEGEGLKFSKHAMNRLNERGIALDETMIDRLEQGVDKAMQKGIKEPLVLIDDLAFVVSSVNKTVITAMGQRDENIFTNIDGAVIN